MAENFKDVGGASVPIEEISIERLAFDLFRHITRKFQLEPVVIYQSNLPENDYTSKTFIEDIARPVLFYSIALRARMETFCEYLGADAMTADRDALVSANDEVFDKQYKSRKRPIYSDVLLSLVISLELTQYLHAKGKGELLKFMPDIWADLFKNRLHDDLEQNGGFEDYISYWEFLKPTDVLVSKFLKKCTTYDSAVSEQFVNAIAVLSWFSNPKHQKKLKDVIGVSPESESPMDPITNVRRSERPKLEPKTNETYSRVVAEGSVLKREEKEKEKEVNILAEGVEKMGQVDPYEENAS